jgi:hypothetical protein
VRYVEIKLGGLVDSCKFVYSGGTSMHCGGKGGNMDERFELLPDEYILSVYFRHTDQLCGIQFQTNRERLSKPYLMGNEKLHWQSQNTQGRPTWWLHEAQAGHQIVGYIGSTHEGAYSCPCM